MQCMPQPNQNKFQNIFHQHTFFNWTRSNACKLDQNFSVYQENRNQPTSIVWKFSLLSSHGNLTLPTSMVRSLTVHMTLAISMTRHYDMWHLQIRMTVHSKWQTTLVAARNDILKCSVMWRAGPTFPPPNTFVTGGLGLMRVFWLLVAKRTQNSAVAQSLIVIVRLSCLWCQSIVGFFLDKHQNLTSLRLSVQSSPKTTKI